MLAQGRTNGEIAAELVLSLKTVRNHVSNIFTKLHVTDRVRAARAGPDGQFELGAEGFHSGDKVRILEGPLAELEGIFQAASDDERVMILLRLMGREVRVRVPGSDIEAV